MKTTDYTFNEYRIPEHMMPGLVRWVTHHKLPGGFLTAVLENDLKEACSRADSENIQNLPAYAAWLYNEAPMSCSGSKANVKAWAEKKIPLNPLTP